MPNEIIMTTQTGDVRIKLRPDLAPNAVERIVTLANEGFYDGVPFGRVSKNLLAQATPPKKSSYPDLAPEFSDVRHGRGVCSMARGPEPDSANAGFFVMLEPAAFVNCQYTIWGQVVEGMEHMDGLPLAEPLDGPPENPGRIVSMRAR